MQVWDNLCGVKQAFEYMSIVVRNVTKIYGQQKALDNVSFDIRKGQVAGFIGPNGAGKSTMMKIITGYIPPTSGEVFVNDLNSVENSLDIRKITGYLPEHNPLYPDMYIIEYLEYVAGLYGIHNHVRELIDEIILKTGIVDEKKKKISALSKGYRQRVGLAQALIHDPEILILDEPTSGLDPNQIVEIRNLISNIGKEKTVILSTHIMQEVEAICDRVIIIDKGKIVADEEREKISRRNAESVQTLIVEFNREVTNELLQTVEGIGQAVNTKSNIWLIQAVPGKDIREDIFEFAVKNGLKVLTMQIREKKLEDVFRDLTK
jgi:ABC-2 type transport system ATP-binding protein